MSGFMGVGTLESRKFVCPNCGVFSQHSTLTRAGYNKPILLPEQISQTGQSPTIAHEHWIVQCPNCAAETYLLVRCARRVAKVGAGGKQVVDEPEAVIHQFPIGTPALDKSVNKDVRSAAIEAEKCLSVEASNACGVMARRAIHSLCADLKAKGADLHKQLTDLRDRHAITPDLWEWAEELRVLGRHGAHPEWEEVTKDDADYAVRFLHEIIRYVYINPAQRQARRVRETGKKKPTQ